MRRAIVRVRGLSLAVKLSVVVLVSVAVIFVGAFEYNYRMSRQIILKNVELAAQNLTQATAGSITSLLAPLETLVQYVSMDIEQRSLSGKELELLVSQTVSSNSAIFGAAIAFEPNSYAANSQYVMYYAHHEGDGIAVEKVGDASYDYHFMDWYIIPKLLGRPIWSEPYFDEGAGNITMATYSAPFFHDKAGQRTFWGINTIDISLEWLHEIVSKVSLYKSGYAFIISGNGVFLTHPAQDFMMRESIFSQAEEHANAAAREAGKNMVQGKTGFVRVNDFRTNSPCWLYYAPLS
ncbi:MAG: cache domain-containing protein, partial [Candidatus Hydrogenedentes bacterium]|nr:cache domain-containing protein [Candidatus Hydrogenedentota bacterium]